MSSDLAAVMLFVCLRGAIDDHQGCLHPGIPDYALGQQYFADCETKFTKAIGECAKVDPSPSHHDFEWKPR